MSAEKFLSKYGRAKSTISDLSRRWLIEKRVDDFLGTEVAAGVVIADVLQGDGMVDAIPEDVQRAFSLVIDKKADTLAEIREGLIERLDRGDDAIRGLMSNLQGRIGELEFAAASGGIAEMSKNEAQEGWDLVSLADGDPHYVQVKVYQSADAALEKIREVEAKLDSGEILGHFNEEVDAIDFAVNSEIFEEVKSRAAEEGLETTVLDLGASRDEIRERLADTFENVQDPLDNFFSEFMGGVLTAAAIHAMVNGYLTYKKAKDWQTGLEDTIYATAVTTGGIAITMATEVLIVESIGFLAAGPLGAAVLIGTGMGSRAILRRLADRRYFAKRLVAGNIRLRTLISDFEGAAA